MCGPWCDGLPDPGWVRAATGSVRAATLGTIGAFGIAYSLDSTFAVADELDGWKRLSPFDRYLRGDPLNNGIDSASAGLFVGFSARFGVAAVALFGRRDPHRG